MTTHRMTYNDKTYTVTWKQVGNRHEIIDLDVKVVRPPRVNGGGANYFRRVPKNGTVWTAIEDQLNQ